MKDSYDIVIIGSGPGGYVAAIKAAKLGKRTAVIEKGDIGGTCLNRGCIPTKTLMHSTRFLTEIKLMEEAGLSFTGLNLDYNKLMVRKNEVVSRIRKGIEGLFKANGVTVYQGEAKIISKNKVRITSDDNVSDIEAENILIATGSVPVIPPIPGSDLEDVVTSDDLLDGDNRLYRKLLIIGGGHRCGNGNDL